MYVLAFSFWIVLEYYGMISLILSRFFGGDRFLCPEDGSCGTCYRAWGALNSGTSRPGGYSRRGGTTSRDGACPGVRGKIPWRRTTTSTKGGIDGNVNSGVVRARPSGGAQQRSYTDSNTGTARATLRCRGDYPLWGQWASQRGWG